MRILRVALVMGVSVVLNFSSAQAEAVGSGVGVDTTCAQYTDLDQHDTHSAHLAFLSWTQGFMTGFNFARLRAGQKSVDLSLMDQNELEANVRKECAANPSEAFLSVVIELYRHLAELGKIEF
jgi:hypothetical protein